ncbi:MAG: DUF3990 domain-containing protein [Propionibacteriaceae bacterium]|jgi:hypothetical protein|nr:DUF3990 domain-containing protein [Propionibacteriaceae bacterium]
MRLYHGSDVAVAAPRLVGQRRGLDFGSGFYTTSNLTQAERFSANVARRRRSSSQFVSEYDFDENVAFSKLDVLSFSAPDGDWLDFVFACRSGSYDGPGYDLVVGPVANDDVYPTLQAFAYGVLTREQAIDALRVRRLYNQYVFRSEEALSFLEFVSAFSPVEASG